MEETNNALNSMNVETLAIKDGKYLVKFPFLDVPVEVGNNFYETFLQN